MKNVILCGYNLIGCEVLSKLITQNYNIYVYTHKSPYYIPDLISYCEKLNIPFTTDKICLENLPFKPDIICSIYYRYIISNEVIEYCKKRIFNLHPSILPNYRGCSSITWAIINGEEFTGFTYHYVDLGIDTGSIIIQKKIKIQSFDSQISLYYKVMIEALNYFNDAFEFVINNKKGIIQKEKANYYPRGVPYNGEISKNWDKTKTERFIRAMIHPPLPLAKFENKTVESYALFIKLLDEK